MGRDAAAGPQAVAAATDRADGSAREIGPAEASGRYLMLASVRRGRAVLSGTLADGSSAAFAVV